MKRIVSMAVMLLLILLLAACEDSSRWQGTYAGQRPGPEAGAVTLRLEADGKGQWEIDGESTLLRWEKRQGALWLHFKSGAVLLARPEEAAGALVLELPSVGTLHLDK